MLGMSIITCTQLNVSIDLLYYSGISAGIYTTGSADICQYILNDSKSDVAMVDDQEQNLSKIVKVYLVDIFNHTGILI